jgi:hypothetical protein
MMNGYPAYPQRPFPQANNGQSMMDMGGDSMDFGNMPDGQSLSDIISQNDKENRRRSMPVYPPGSMQHLNSPDSRRLSMMNFGGDAANGPTGTFEDFQFSMTANPGMDDIISNATPFPQPSTEMRRDRVPATDLAINTHFPNQNSAFPNMQGPGSAYASPMHPSMSMDPMDMASPYPTTMSMPLDMNDPSLALMGADMNMLSGAQFGNPMMDSPITQDFVSPMPGARQDPSLAGMQPSDQYGPSSNMSGTPDMRSSLPTRANSQDQTSARSSSRPHSEQRSSAQSIPGTMPTAPMRSQDPSAPTAVPRQDSSQEIFNGIKLPWSTPPGMCSFPASSTRHSVCSLTRYQVASPQP